MFAVEDRLADYERVAERTRAAGRVRQGGSGCACRPRPRGRPRRRATASMKRSPHPSAIEVLQIPGAEGRPQGPRFGTLVHAVLAIVPLDAR